MKTLRHPSILNYNEGMESDNKIYVVTEFVVPLKQYIRHLDRAHLNNFICCGFSRLINLLIFLNETHLLAHNNVCLDCVFVNNAGDWRIGGLEYMTHVNESTRVIDLGGKSLKINTFPREIKNKIIKR
ncbi:N-terminal kinase-like protein [Octopus sinensis]|uniref:N-terminal kinase-like protein n=1 Tax=Octopus sinensis TaxID=2607531 RepID=A0A7E6EK87_9MOLL|nr:N-terminal kinase-like protein [Octopus sinensis]